MKRLRIALAAAFGACGLVYAYAQTPAGAPFFQSLSVQGASTFNGLATFNGGFTPNSLYPCSVATGLATCAANAPAGSTIMLDPGNVTYTVSTNITVTRFNVTIACPSWGTVIQRSATLTGVMLSINGSGSVLRDCSIDGNGAVNTTNISAEVSVAGTYAGVEHNRWVNSHIRSVALAADYAWASHNNIIGMGPTSPTLQTTGIWAEAHKLGINISDNTIVDTGIDGIGADGIGTIVARNRLSNCHCYTGIGGGAIVIYPMPSLTVSAATWSAGQVTFTTTAAHGVAVADMFIVDGMTPAAWNGTYFAAAGTAGTTLVAARVSDPGSATVMGNLALDKGTGILVADNMIDKGCGPDSYGIEINSRHTEIIGNIVRNQRHSGIVLNVTADYIDITGNTISNSNQSRYAFPPVPAININEGVRHVSISGGQLVDDQAEPTQQFAVYIRRTADFITLNTADVTGNSIATIHNESGGTHIKYGAANLDDTLTNTPVAGRLYAEPFWISTGTGSYTIKELAANIVATTGGSVRLGVYADNGTPNINPGPGNKIYDSGILSVAALGKLTSGAVTISTGCNQCYVWVVSAWSSTTTPGVASQPVPPNPMRGLYSSTYADATLATALPASFGTVSAGTTPVPILTPGF